MTTQVIGDTRPMRERMELYVNDLQDRIVTSLESLDPTSPPFKRDSWVRSQGGSGRSCVFALPASDDEVAATSARTQETPGSLKESVLEKAGVNISVVHGLLPPAAIKQMRADHSSMPLPDSEAGLPFFAAGLSLVIHPRNPHAPTAHANYRYFEITEPLAPTPEDSDADEPPAKKEPKVLAWWFGGGCDLTPSYLYEDDAEHFHSTIKSACDSHGYQLYPTFKKWCDEYFYIPHRGETRGVGGIFFDDLNEGQHFRFPKDTQFSAEIDAGGPTTTAAKRPTALEDIFAFVRSAGDAFVPSYIPLLQRRHSMPYTPKQRRWQLIRRGRYVEFNLVYDRGTKFGLMTPGARIESILMSLPETARWEYMSEMGSEEGSEEEKLMRVLKEARTWV
ncbi:coproporphyrinogen III oxidase [Coprinopsis marcescibilis]|uniref:coproporphyrinogen oxidase n=1 Tax=Coprinopsis marcescibilis TaxID=230819 RepID=A0A5C3KXI7_COPMA|nr:coproporphyrinogen III oxidase [Coprinopsis marcescibilis]